MENESSESFLLPPNEAEATEKPIELKKFRLFVVSVLGAVILFFFGVLTAAVYLLPFNDKFVRFVTSLVPYPIVVVNMEPITFNQFYDEWAAMQNYYQSASDLAARKPTDEELAANLVESITERVLVRQLAGQYGLRLDAAKVEEAYQLAVQESASEETFLVEIKKTFGWDKQEVIDTLFSPMVLAAQVETAVQADASLQATAAAKAEAALARIKNNEDFSVVAAAASEDTSADSGGDLGNLTADELPDEWLDFLSVSGLNTPSEIIDLGSVYSIIEAVDQTQNSEGATQYHLKAVIVYKKLVDEVLESFTAASKIWNFLKI